MNFFKISFAAMMLGAFLAKAAVSSPPVKQPDLQDLSGLSAQNQ